MLMYVTKAKQLERQQNTNYHLRYWGSDEWVARDDVFSYEIRSVLEPHKTQNPRVAKVERIDMLETKTTGALSLNGALFGMMNEFT